MSVKGINFKSLALAGLVSGYVMFFVDHWFAGFLGLFGAYPGTENVWWMITHHVDSIVFAFLFAVPLVYRSLPGGGWLKGIVFGIVWTILLSIVSLIAGALGAEMFAHMPFSPAAMISNLILHVIWGIVLGMIYVAPQDEVPAM